MANARFFDFINGSPVKITLRDGEEITHRSGGPTDEGYSYTLNGWHLSDGVVTMETVTRALDCDGRLDTHLVLRCPITDLKRGGIDGENKSITYPAWQSVKRGQRDYSAEAMGY